MTLLGNSLIQPKAQTLTVNSAPEIIMFSSKGTSETNSLILITKEKNRFNRGKRNLDY